MGRMADNDANALSQIRNGARARVLYLYLVQGWNMKDIAEEVFDDYDDFSSQRVSVVTRSYGFHQGRGRGRYRDIPESLIKSFVRDHAPEDDEYGGGLDEGTFDRYVANYRRKQQRQQQAERERRERERKAAAEAQYGQYLAQGKQALAAGRLNDAHRAFLNARERKDTWGLNLLLAETMAKFSNAKDFADQIIQELTEYLNEKKDMTWEQYRWLAEAYLARGDKNSACTYYFAAGDKCYNKDDFVQADKLYAEGREKCSLYEPGHAFRIAYARSKAHTPPTEEDNRFCNRWYKVCREKDDGRDNVYAYCNAGYHHNCLKEYRETVDLLTPWAERGSKEKLVFRHLANACYNLEMWTEAARWYKEAARKGAERNHYRIGYALARQEKYAEALSELTAYTREEGKEEYEAYDRIVECAKQNGDDREVSEYRLKSLELREEWNRDLGETWLEAAEEHGFSDLAGRMLELLPKVRERREEERRRKEEEERLREEERKRLEAEALAREKRRKEEEMLLLLM